MRKLIIILIVFIIFFITNLIFYTFSDNYKFFIKKIKNPEKVVYTKDKDLSDEITVTGSKNMISTGKTLTGNINNNSEKSNKEKFSNTGQVILGEQYQKLLNTFGEYKLGKLEVLNNERLFDLTDEYPDGYYEYYSKDLTLYLFTTKSYKEVLDIFKVISGINGSIFSVNETNNFGDKSFFLNLKGEEETPQIRMVSYVKGLVFGLKFNKNQYNRVKEIFNNK